MKEVDKIIQQCKQKYEKFLLKTMKKPPVRFLDKLESEARKIEKEGEGAFKDLHLTYYEETLAWHALLDAVEAVDKKYFGVYSVGTLAGYDFHNMSETLKKALAK